ncbi:MAG: hypothetical protein FJW30_18390 [Acidobacteria bacterium]|nr:hypothetical protein [Acidobacteriota bacterium]
MRRLAFLALMAGCAKAPKPALAVLPASWTFIDRRSLNPVDVEIARRVSAGRKDCAAWESLLVYQSSAKTVKTIAAELHVPRVMAIAVHNTSVSAFLVNAETALQLWAANYELTTADEVAARILREMPA